MPTLALYTPPAVPDAWHRTLSPGGYEAWHLTLFDAGTETFVGASLMTGCQYQPEYLRRYGRYLGDPTRVAPPLPPDWPSVHVVVFREGKLYAESLTQYPQYSVAASVGSLDVHVALDRLWRMPDGSVRLTLRGRPLVYSRLGRRHPAGLLQLDLTLYTISPPVPLNGLFIEASGPAEHLWAPLASPCTARGELTIRRGAGGKVETLAIAGRASLDHELGTRPLSEGFTAWVRGAAFLPHAVVPVRVGCATARPSDRLAALYDAEGGFRAFPPTAIQASWTRTRRTYPTHLDAGPLLRLDSPRVMEGRGPVMTVIYRATTSLEQEAGWALCRVLHPDQVEGRYGGYFHRPVREGRG
jgi:hypothetical protein